MEKQPAKINYFFGKCYRDLGKTIKYTFRNLGNSVANCASHMRDSWKSGWNPIGMIKIGFWLGLLIWSAIISTIICIAFSVVHIALTVAMMAIIYILFSLLWLVDTVMCRFRKIVSSCPNCQKKFSLPHYQCSGCGRVHTKLKPSKYGILKRECDCGKKIPTTFLNGRQKLNAICPECGFNLKGGGFLVNISIPVIGGPSSGKTCYVNMALQELEKMADSELGYNYEHIEQGTDRLKQNLSLMSTGALPEKTNEMRLMYYEFFFSPKKSKVKNQISICDVGGEVYQSSQGLNEQIGYNYANGFLMIIDPLAISSFRKELEQTQNLKGYNGSNMPIDEILALLIKTLENMRNLSAKGRIDENLAIVFTKCDMPLISDKIGETAVADLAASNEKMTKMQARNTLCEQFLAEYDETGFINTVKSKFNHVQYFTCSALGHNVDGTKFVPTGVADPILWLIDKQSPTIDFKKYWNKN